MSELRSGGGRMQPSRRDIVTKDGELVPVTLAASIIYEDGREVASVGIISDLRERLKIEQRLAQAQEKLMLSEKQALIAELAGTTAHELNQPLTSVMGYSELLKKKMTPEDPSFRAIDIILREAERMAEIVRKIGRITRYETKAYVGSTQILDLDKSIDRG
jgi:signal transduction histidine kinase